MFSAVIAMYRALGRPQVVDGAFAFSGQVSAETYETIHHVQSLPPHFGHFEDASYENGDFNCEFFLPSSEHGRFHRSLADFIASAPSLSFGEIPSEFYIQELNYYSRDESMPAQIVQLNDICRLIKGLTALAAGSAPNNAHSNSENRLLFVLAADGKSPAKTISLPIQLSAADLIHSLPHVRLIELLVSDQVKNEIHVEERRSIMRLAVAEVLSIPDDQTKAFSYMLRHWRLVLEKYRHNVLAFVSQYAFEKVRKEIATAEIDHATKLSGVLGDIAGKLLALPVSLAAIILLRKAATREEFWIGFAGLCAVSIIFGGVLWNQWLQVTRLRGSFDFIFGQYDEDAFPKKLRLPIATAKKNINRQYRVLRCTFAVFGGLAALPAAGAFYIALTPIPFTLADACLLIGIR